MQTTKDLLNKLGNKKSDDNVKKDMKGGLARDDGSETLNVVGSRLPRDLSLTAAQGRPRLH